MPKFAANLTMLFTEYDFLDRFERAAKAGFKGVEYLFPYPYKVEDLVQRLQANDLAQVLHNLPAGDWGAGERGIACHPGSCRGVPGRRRQSDRVCDGACALWSTALPVSRRRARIRPSFATPSSATSSCRRRAEEADIKLLIEPINTSDIPGFYLTQTNQAIEIIDQTGSDNIFLQYDIYHMQIMEGDLARTVEKNMSRIAPYPAC